jgi:glycosyltransferase involved in cell wall biosynthesis
MDHGIYSYDSGVKKENAPTVVFLGRLRKYKGVQILLRAMASVKDQIPGSRLVVVGDGPYRGVLEKKSLELGLQDAVTFVGHVSQEEKVRLLRTAHVAASPSPKEGWGLTVVEANACGTPVVASRSPGLRDSVRDGETGFLVNHGNHADLAARIVKLLQDDVLRGKMSAAAVRWAGEFTWQRCASECADVMERVAGANTRHEVGAVEKIPARESEAGVMGRAAEEGASETGA